MKTLNLFILALVCSLSFSACEQEEVAPFQMNNSGPTSDIGGFVPNPGLPTVRPDVFNRLNFPNAKGWNIRWQIPSMHPGSFPNIDSEFWDDCAGFLSISDGSLYSLNELNTLGWEATAKMDIYLPIGTLRAPARFPLVHSEHRRNTRFKPSDMTPAKAMKIAQQRPAYFEEAYELNPAQPKTAVPFDGMNPTPLHQENEVYVFKAGPNFDKYGVVIIEDAPAGDVEVTVLVQNDVWKKQL